jgi:hypothetical protein
MQAIHRRRHAWIWIAWAVLLPLGFVLALVLRPPEPVDSQQPGSAAAAVERPAQHGDAR